MLKSKWNFKIFLLFVLFKSISSLKTNLNLKYGEDCITPTNEAGKCVSISSCPSAFATFTELAFNRANNATQRQRLTEAQCGLKHNIPYICCPKQEIKINEKILNYLGGLNCGISVDTKIANGEKVPILKYRWMVLLKYDMEIVFQCDGSLISEQYVLTAAHCFQNWPVAVRLGEYDTESENDCTGTTCIEPYEDIGIKHVFIPDQYIMNGLANDIALISLERKVTFSSIQPICLPITEALRKKVPDWYAVAGWGNTERGSKSTVLLGTNIPHRSLSFCLDKLRTKSGVLNLNITHICAGGERFQDSCRGDSGGPIFRSYSYVDGVVRAIQFGVVSMGVTTCGVLNVPSIYSNVSYHFNWIIDHMTIDFNLIK